MEQSTGTTTAVESSPVNIEETTAHTEVEATSAHESE